MLALFLKAKYLFLIAVHKYFPSEYICIFSLSSFFVYSHLSNLHVGITIVIFLLCCKLQCLWLLSSILPATLHQTAVIQADYADKLHNSPVFYYCSSYTIHIIDSCKCGYSVIFYFTF